MKNWKVVKVYPIENRTDFFKYTIQKNGVLALDFNKKEMYFDCLDHAKNVCKSKNKVQRINKEFLNS
tara:strand:- start:776 stop:976 length:201 start_codon:yes stop_codon:yes gene_type:complete